MIPITIIMVTKNEALNIAHSLPPLTQNFDEVIVVDSNSSDDTVAIAQKHKAKVHNFTWNGKYPKKRQWVLDTIKTKHDWVFMIDADEIITPYFINELRSILWDVDGYFIKSEIVWDHKHLKYGMKNNKLCLFKKAAFYYPIVDDLDLTCMGEIEGHYQPVPKNKNETIGSIKNAILHHDLKNNWHDRHIKYAQWEIAMNKRNAWPLDPIFKRELIKDFIRTNILRPYIILIYGLIIKGGVLDGKKGMDYAIARYRYAKSIINGSKNTRKH